LSGTATRMNDYKAYGATFTTSTTGTVTFAAGSAVAQVDLVTKADTSKESNETIGLQITSGSGYTIGTVSPVITTIINDDLVNNQKGTSGADVLTSGNTKILSAGSGTDILIGGMAGEIFVGGTGNDNITTGLGNDIVSFTQKSQGVDIITDFDPTYDLIQVAATFGGGLIAGQTIDDTQFSKSLSLLTAATRFIYDQTSGGMFFDEDGSGPNAAVKLAALNPTLTNFSAENIFVV
jgi:Ca2+-binding RTX toxin-like protein